MLSSLFDLDLSEDRLPPGSELLNCTLKECGCVTEPVTAPVMSLPLTHDALIGTQKSNPCLAKCSAAAVENGRKCSEIIP